ncbi:MAG: hypothetical protein IIA61_11065 [Candidatus Marinimicrobia bacterium]|nr:hypothetical protein [Candidatus Neomarinimicrobiota bacterium]
MSTNQYRYQFYYRRNLPHIQPKGAIIFITYRLAFSLPKSIQEILINQRKQFDKKLRALSQHKKNGFKEKCNKVLFNLEDEFLDSYHEGPQWLSNDVVAKMIIDNYLYNNGYKYSLKCCLIMSNHVHTILKPVFKIKEEVYSLSEIMHTHKSYTANEANKILDRRGQFWQHESYDHYVRDLDEYNRILAYILNNPVRAGLVKDYHDWPYYWIEK